MHFFTPLSPLTPMRCSFSTKRQQFLVQQGYAFKVVANIFDESVKHQLLFHTREDQMALLERVLRLDEVAVVDEALVEDDDDITRIDIIFGYREAKGRVDSCSLWSSGNVFGIPHEGPWKGSSTHVNRSLFLSRSRQTVSTRQTY